ncbi:MAG: hypothetical protein ACKVUS_09395 [Saprospiraceae bacterium]
MGGGGALFFPRVNPANDQEFYGSCDMSQLFHSTDFGNFYEQIPFQHLAVSGANSTAGRFLTGKIFTSAPTRAFSTATMWRHVVHAH